MNLGCHFWNIEYACMYSRTDFDAVISPMQAESLLSRFDSKHHGFLHHLFLENVKKKNTPKWGSSPMSHTRYMHCKSSNSPHSHNTCNILEGPLYHLLQRSHNLLIITALWYLQHSDRARAINLLLGVPVLLLRKLSHYDDTDSVPRYKFNTRKLTISQPLY